MNIGWNPAGGALFFVWKFSPVAHPWQTLAAIMAAMAHDHSQRAVWQSLGLHPSSFILNTAGKSPSHASYHVGKSSTNGNTNRKNLDSLKLIYLLVRFTKEFSGMIHWLTINNHPSNPQQPIHSLRLARTSKVKDPAKKYENSSLLGAFCRFPK